MAMKIAIINGPNLNLVGVREPDVYGSERLDDYLCRLVADFPNGEFTTFQSNHEGDLIDEVQRRGFACDAIIINAGGYTHTSIALQDALRAVPARAIEVHISDITRREPYRRHSMLAEACVATIMGQGLDGYRQAVKLAIAGGAS